jgi:hypothetical protein
VKLHRKGRLTYPPGSTERRGDFEIKQQSRGAEVRLDFKGEAKTLRRRDKRASVRGIYSTKQRKVPSARR